MIGLNEVNEYAAEVTFTLPLASDPLTGVTGWSFTLGEVQVKLPGSASWINVAVNKIVEKGFGRFCARLTSSQCTTEGVVALVANLTGSTEQPYFGSETISTIGGDIAHNGTGYILFFLPNETDPIYGAPVTTADFTTTGVLKICLPDDVYRDATSGEKASVINLGFGGYALPITTTHTIKRGKIFIYVTYPGAQRFEDYSTILGIVPVTGSVIPSTPSLPVHVTSPISIDSPTYIDHITHALNRLTQQFKSDDEPVL